MTRRRRGVVLLALALVLGGLAASDVARREATLERALSPAVPVVVARKDMPAGRRLRTRDLSIRDVPARYAPPDAAVSPRELTGARLDVAVPAGGYLGPAHLAAPPGLPTPAVRPGERAAEVVANGAPELVVAGARVDVLVTRDHGGRRATTLALQDVEVLASEPAADPAGERPVRQVAATLRVTLRQAVYLTAAQSFAREIRLLPRAAGDRGRASALRIGGGLG